MVAIGISIYAHIMNGRSHVVTGENCLSFAGIYINSIKRFCKRILEQKVLQYEANESGAWPVLFRQEEMVEKWSLYCNSSWSWLIHEYFHTTFQPLFHKLEVNGKIFIWLKLRILIR